MIQALQLVFRGLIVLISLFVLVNFSPVVLAEWNGEDACPKIGPLPACYLVFLCYALMGLAAAIAPRRLVWLFVIGWVPVFAMALTGSTLEVMGRGTCPVSEAGVPMCYFSLTLALVLLPVFAVAAGMLKMPSKKEPL